MGIIIGLILYGLLIYYICNSFNSKVTFGDWIITVIFFPLLLPITIISYVINLFYKN
jgi:hypothetical protein